MESEHEQFSSFAAESDGANHQHVDEANHSNAAKQEGQGAEHASAESSSATKRRRWRPERSSSRRNAASAEHATPEGASEGEQAHAEQPSEESPAPETTTDAVSLQRESSGFEDEGAKAATTTSGEPGTDLETTTPAASFWGAASDLDIIALPGAVPETAPSGDEETIAAASTTESTEASPADAAAQFAQESAAEAPYESTRAPLSGVEVRPPRRYRFDRPAPTVQEKREPIAQPKQAPQPLATEQASIQPTIEQQEQDQQPTSPPTAPAQPVTRQPAAAAQHPARHHTAHKRERPAVAAPTRATEGDPALTTAMELELTETPEVEAEVEAAEELARATQTALEEEVAEALESFTQQEQTASARSSRRRRRRSPTSASTAPTESAPEKGAAIQPPFAAPQPPVTTNQSFGVSAAQSGQNYQVNNGLQQIGQPQSPFAGPEPSSARGFGPVPRGVASPAERNVRLPRTDRAIETNNVTMNQLAMLFTQAMQQQTDRLLMELRRNQGTPSMTVNFPPMPSTERIGVFVDVANLLYSARNMRIAIDFGRLLDFLRGNRRLIRAHAYCPTSPDPRAEQMFLDAVKGLGYRITTKNYKTFSSGAKKADLDLDMCMDIVRLVDAEAVDCISLVSGDSDFLPLLEYCSDHGVRVEVAAFDEATAGILRQSCDLFINLSLVEDIRA
ncbi:MAG TPA: NYN domain-containing protein [Ktedonobacterales bacterium]